MADSSTVQSRSHLSWIPYLQVKVVSPVSPAATRLISNCQVTGKSASNTQEEISEYVDRVTKRYISFTEVCAHGTIPQCGEGERRLSSTNTAHTQSYGTLATKRIINCPGLTENQQELTRLRKTQD